MKYKKLCLIIVLSIFLNLAVTFGTFAATVNIAIDGNYISFDSSYGEPFVDSRGRTQVPLRAVMEAFGCEVTWDNLSQTAFVSKNGTMVSVPIGEKHIVKNGITIPNDTSAQIKDGRTYLPIRAVFEAFGAYVEWSSELNCVNVITTSPLMQVIFLDVGQGDSTLVDFGTYEVLIDAGDNNKAYAVADKIKPYVDGNIELVIATHPDSDHIGGMDYVLDNYNADMVIDSGFTKDTKTYTDYITAVQNDGCVFEYDSDAVIDLGSGAYLKIFESGDNYNNANDMSVVAGLYYGNSSVLFTGDISSNVEKNILSAIGDIDVLKVAHHGSSTSTSQAFLNATKPEYAVVSAGFGNSYGHPKSDVLQRLFSTGTKVLGTMKSSDIILNINSQSYNFNKSDYLSLTDAGSSAVIQTEQTEVGNFSAAYIGNKNSKKFHVSGCTYASKMNDSNMVYFSAASDAVNNGYTPCKSCNPY